MTNELNVEKANELYRSRSIHKHKVALKFYHATQQKKLPYTASKHAKPKVEVKRTNVPNLSWLCRIQPNQYCKVTVGAGVEVAPGRISEGVWDGNFLDRDFHKSQYLFGSGIAWGKHLVFAPPKHCWEYLFVLQDKVNHNVLVSNSLNFALEAGHVLSNSKLMMELDAHLFDRNNEATAAGIGKYDPLVAEDYQFRFYRMIFYNFTADAEGNIRILPNYPEAPFTNYAEYRNFLQKKVDAICVNANDGGRQNTLPPITPVSSGYDSPCVAVLAREAGQRDAVTFDISVKGRSDSGADIGKKLGLEVRSVTHVLGRNVPDLGVNFEGDLEDKVAEFVATPGVGDDVAFLTMEQVISGRTFLSGAMGDSVWRRNSKLEPGLPARVIYGKSITEFRLRAGFAWVPVPAIGARFPSCVKKITRSEEMQPWTLWTSYDRPFPRRVVEEQGIDRKYFGLAKSATSPTVMNRGKLFVHAVKMIRTRYKEATFVN